MERISTRSPSGMTLRSACDGSCTSQASSSLSSSGASLRQSRVHHHHHNHSSHHDHHHHHRANQQLHQKVVVKTAAISTRSSALTARSLDDSQSNSSRTSYRERIAGKLASLAKSQSLEDSESSSKTVSGRGRLAVETGTVHRQTSTSLVNHQNQHSDYWSDDELDSDDRPKTDYTYAYSYSYNRQATPDEPCPSPNMSRHGLRSSGSSDSSPALSHRTVSAVGSSGSFLTQHGFHAAAATTTTTTTTTSNTLEESSRRLLSGSSERHLNSDSHVRNGIAISSGSLKEQHAPAWYMDSMYGLDSDSDAELPIETRSQVTVLSTSQDSWSLSRYKSLLNRAGFLKSIYYAWFLLWSTMYWTIASVILLDTFILVRTRQFMSSGNWLRKMLLLALLLIPLWLANSGTSQKAIVTVSSAVASSLSYLPLSGVFLTRPSNVVEVKEMPVEKGWLSSDTFSTVVRQVILQVYGKPEEGKDATVDDRKLYGMIRDIVQQEISSLGLSESLERQNATQKRESLEHLEFLKLKERIEAIALQAFTLKEEFQSVKVELDGWRQGSHTVEDNELLSKLQTLLLGLEEKILHLEKNHGLLLAAMHNCCRNHTDYMAFIEEHIALTLNKMSDLHEPESCDRFANFRSWLELFFVTRTEADQSMDKLSAKVKPSLLADMDAKLKEAVDLAAAKYVHKYLQQQHSTRVEKQSVKVDLEGEAFENTLRALIREQLVVYDADKTGLPDFALESSGGSVVSTRCTETYQIRTAQWSILGIPLWYWSNSPRIIIQPGVRPGECWAIKGSQGFVVIQLSGLVNVSAFSLEHIPKSISPTGSIDSAPKEFSVWGLETERDNGTHLGDFVYLEDGEPLQFFLVKNKQSKPFSMVELRIHSNHGNVEYTCLYRFRVHGVLVQS